MNEGVVLQASLGAVGCIKRLVLAGRKEVGGIGAIDRPLEDRNKVFFMVGLRYTGRIGDVVM